jgi:hypothetical protein
MKVFHCDMADRHFRQASDPPRPPGSPPMPPRDPEKPSPIKDPPPPIPVPPPIPEQPPIQVGVLAIVSWVEERLKKRSGNGPPSANDRVGAHRVRRLGAAPAWRGSDDATARSAGRRYP